MGEPVDWFIAPFEYAFMQRALASLIIVSVVGSVVGTFVVHKGLAASGSGLAPSTTQESTGRHLPPAGRCRPLCLPHRDAGRASLPPLRA